ncbi:MAG: hypothetical protein C0498_05300 [Anaerolinea sp.]|nr:hypothetical protein [Anaerolinea sp.]
MNEYLEPDPLDALRAADPVDADRLSSASLARIRARISEDVMTETITRGAPRRARLFGLGAGAAALATFALVLILGGRGSAPGIVPAPPDGTGSDGTSSASCVEPYSPTALANRSFAFDGAVTAIDGERVTFAVNEVFRGAQDETVTLDAPGMTGTSITSAGGPNLSVGERYLVAGDDTFVWACGYTQPFDAAVAAEWAAALGG